jgi:hypothetical protein
MKKIIFFIYLIAPLLLVTYFASAAGIEQTNPYIQWFKTTIGTVLNTNQVAITASPTLIKAAPSTGHYRYSITIRNLDSANSIYLGNSSVNTAAGFPLKANEALTTDRNFAAIYGICSANQTATAAYFEEAK